MAFFDGLSADCENLTNNTADEFVKSGLTLFVVFEHCRGVENLFASVVDVVGYGIFRFLVRACRAVVNDKLRDHAEVFVQGVRVFRNRLEVERCFACEDISYLGCFARKTSGQNEQAHNLDDAYRFLLDVVQLLRGVEDAEGVFLVRAVVAQDEVELIFAVLIDGCNGGDCVVLDFFAVFARCAAKDIYALVAIIVPRSAEFVGDFECLVAVGAFYAND